MTSITYYYFKIHDQGLISLLKTRPNMQALSFISWNLKYVCYIITKYIYVILCHLSVNLKCVKVESEKMYVKQGFSSWIHNILITAFILFLQFLPRESLKEKNKAAQEQQTIG